MVMSLLRRAVSLLRKWNTRKKDDGFSQYLLTTNTINFLDEYDSKVNLGYAPPKRNKGHLKFAEDEKNLTHSLTLGEWWGDTDMSTLKCPVCENEYNHLGEPIKERGEDGYEAYWGGRGDLVTIPIEGECGCEWKVCFGFHKGNIAAFTRVTKPCKEDL